MVKEVDWQTKLRKVFERTGNYCKKWSTQHTVGVPDLICSFEKIGGTLIEVKLEKKWFVDTVRTIDLTEKQRSELSKWQKTGSPAGILVVCEYKRSRYILRMLEIPKSRETLKTSKYSDDNRDWIHWSSTQPQLITDFVVDWLKIKGKPNNG